MANPLKLPFDFAPNSTPTTQQLQANLNALLQFVSDLNTAVISLSNLLVGTLQTTSTATIGGALAANGTATVAGALMASNNATVAGALVANGTATVAGALTANSTLTATGALTANSTSALNGAVTAGSTLAATGDITASSNVKLSDNTNALQWINSPNMGLTRVSADNMAIKTASTTGWNLDSSGNITLPIQPAFLETMTSGTNKFGDGPAYTIVWDTEVLDRSSSFNLATGIFTAPVAGVYAFVCFLDTSSVNVSPATPTVTIVTTARSYYNNLPAYTTATCRGLSVAYTQMSAADTAKVTIAGASLLGTKTAGIDFGYFAGFLFG